MAWEIEHLAPLLWIFSELIFSLSWLPFPPNFSPIPLSPPTQPGGSESEEQKSKLSDVHMFSKNRVFWLLF